MTPVERTTRAARRGRGSRLVVGTAPARASGAGAGAGAAAGSSAGSALALAPRLGLRLGLGLVDDRVATEPFGVGQTADAVGRGVVDARRVALDADLELLGEIEHHLVLDAELSRQLVDADLLRCQACCLCFL